VQVEPQRRVTNAVLPCLLTLTLQLLTPVAWSQPAAWSRPS